MTSYHGGKQKIGKDLAKIIVEETADICDEYNFTVKGYCEPFCGMLGVYQNIPSYLGDINYKAGDINKSVVLMWKAAQKGWNPPKKRVSRKEFMTLAGDGTSSAYKGYVGHLYGYMSKYFKPFKAGDSQRRLDNSAQRVKNISQQLSDVKFTHGKYNQFSRLKGYVIYCDPPYAIQSNYYDECDRKRTFDNEKFWDWCREMSVNNIVFISEYSAPKDFDRG